MGEPRALIIAPTRELVVQIAKDAADLTKYTGLNVMTFVGGMDFDKQLKHLEARHCDILVATPGRLLDFNQRGDVHLDMVEVMVLDEADRMLDMGFIPQVRQIIRQTPPKNERQTLLFSATFTEDVMNLAKQWTTDPAIVEIESQNVASENVEQHIYAVAGADKYKLLFNLVNDNGWERVIVFANRKDEVRRIEERLVRDGVNAAQLSGDVPQHKRIKTLEGFREGKIRVLVATDVAGRGIHIDGISHVINFTASAEPVAPVPTVCPSVLPARTTRTSCRPSKKNWVARSAAKHHRRICCGRLSASGPNRRLARKGAAGNGLRFFFVWFFQQALARDN
jgi:ATP-dependent RNA helicase RhlB